MTAYFTTSSYEQGGGHLASRPATGSMQDLNQLGKDLRPDLETLLSLQGISRKTLAHELAPRIDLKEPVAKQWIGYLISGNWTEWFQALINPQPNLNIHVQRLKIALAHLGVRTNSDIVARIQKLCPEFEYDHEAAGSMQVTSQMRRVWRSGGTYRRQSDGPQYPTQA